MTSPAATWLATPGGSGAMGAARDVPEAAAKTKAVIATANAIRIIFSS
jgi:hypothetical protein